MAGRRKLLVVDDQPDICEVIQIYLTDQGYDVDYVTDCISAERWFEMQVCDLLILDMLMPGGGNLLLIEYTKKKDMPVLLMSGNPKIKSDIAARISYHFLLKPFHFNELQAAVRSAMENHSTRA